MTAQDPKGTVRKRRAVIAVPATTPKRGTALGWRRRAMPST